MKLSLPIPDLILRRTQREAKRRAISVHQFVNDALIEKLGPEPVTAEQSRLRGINAIIEEEFGRVNWC